MHAAASDRLPASWQQRIFEGWFVRRLQQCVYGSKQRVSFIPPHGMNTTKARHTIIQVTSWSGRHTGPEGGSLGEKFVVAHVVRAVAGKGQANHSVENI